MITDKFNFENKDYVIALQNNNAMVFYREELDSYSWFFAPIPIVNITNDVHDAIKLIRLMAEKVKQLLYKNKIRYFNFTVKDGRRRLLHIKFLKKLSGYEFQISNNIYQFL